MSRDIHLPPDQFHPELRQARIDFIRKLQTAGWEVNIWTMQRANLNNYLVIQAEGPRQAKMADQRLIYFLTYAGDTWLKIPITELNDFMLWHTRVQVNKPEWKSVAYVVFYDTGAKEFRADKIGHALTSLDVALRLDSKGVCPLLDAGEHIPEVY
jgi:hypothetical protein